VRGVSATLLIIGYSNGTAFEEHFETYEEYRAALSRWQGQVEQEKTSNAERDFDALEDPPPGKRN